MSESLPDKCPFCGANYHGEGKTDEWEWVQYKCSTEFENGEWLQDDECRIAQLEATLTARESELADAKRRVVELEEALKLWMTYDGMGNPDPLSILLMARNATATLLRITRIPGKEDDDGEMH